MNNPEKYINLGILEQVIGHGLRSLIVRDRDGLPGDLLEEIRREADQQGRRVVVLERTQIENYVLSPTIIARVIHSDLTVRDGEAPPIEEITGEIERVVEALKDEAFDNSAAHIQQHYATYRAKHIDAKNANALARGFLEEQWQTIEGKIRVVEGRKALKAIRTRVQAKWAVSFSDTRIIDAMTTEEIPEEIGKIIRLLEKL